MRWYILNYLDIYNCLFLCALHMSYSCWLPWIIIKYISMYYFKFNTIYIYSLYILCVSIYIYIFIFIYTYVYYISHLYWFRSFSVLFVKNLQVKVLVSSTWQRDSGQVAILSGGGSGHEPADAGM